jgi:WD40 repeat protein
VTNLVAITLLPKGSIFYLQVTMVGHSDTVRCLQMIREKQLVVSGSYDETLKIW